MPNEGRDNTYREEWWRLVLSIPELTPGSRMIALVISTHARANGLRAVASLEKIAADAGMGESTARKHLKWLRDRDLVVQVARGGRNGDGLLRASTYKLVKPISTAQPSEQLTPASTATPGEHLTPTSTARSDVSTAQSDVSTARLGEHPPSSSPRNPPTGEVTEIIELLATRDGRNIEDARRLAPAVYEFAVNDSSTEINPVGRLAKSDRYRRDVIGIICKRELDKQLRCGLCFKPQSICETAHAY